MLKIIITSVLMFNTGVYAQSSFNSIITKTEISTVAIKIVRDRIKNKDSETVISGGGSGFFISTQGHILTNAHVVEGAKEILVTTLDLKIHEASVIGSDGRTDIAVLKINAVTVPIAIGNYNLVKKGDTVIALGSPFGLDWSATKGMVSHTARDTGKLLLMLQSDTPINTGNSGGPLLNTLGQVIAVNSGLITESGSYQGISLAIPIDKAIAVANKLKQLGYLNRASLNLELIDTDNGNPDKTNVLVYNVLNKNSNLKQDDIILKVNNQTVSKSLQVARLINDLKIGDIVNLSILRDTKVISVNQVLK